MTGNDYMYTTVTVSLLIIISVVAIRSGLSFTRKYWRWSRRITLLARGNESRLLVSELELREQTMKSISREIHDNIGQILSLVSLQLNSIDISNNPAITGKIRTSMELLNKAVSGLRDIVGSMDAASLARSGLTDAVRSNLELISRTGLITVSFRLHGKENDLRREEAIAVYRIIQESLQNIIKHAQATEISVVFQYFHSILLVSVSDNGRGFDVFHATSSGHDGSGLQNMRCRAELIGAKLNIESRPGSGTTVQVLIPIDPAIHA